MLIRHWFAGIISRILKKGVDPVRESVREAYQAQYYPLGYVPAHDGMRGLMTLGVVAAHISYRTVPGAALYIDFFFAASAYYITSLLLRDIEKRGRIDYGQFYLRRFARLVPPLLLMLAVYLLCSWLFLPPFFPALKRAAIVLTYTSNYWYVFDPKSIEDLGHTWTLSTEEQFYILWPVIFACLVRRLDVTWRLVMAIGAIGAAIWAWRISLLLQGAGPLRLYTALDTRADALMGGCAMAVILKLVPQGKYPTLDRLWPSLAWPLLLYWVAVTFLFWPATGPSLNYYYFGSMLCGVIPGTVLMTMLIRSSGTICHRIFERPEAIFLGRIFYGIYLWHLPILNFMDSYGVGWRYRLLFGLPLSIAFATLSYAYVERYFLRRRTTFARPQPQAPFADGAPALSPLLVRSKEASSTA
jgi:peptidoglycan/LPS O-acetylase OafA/YrhL